MTIDAASFWLPGGTILNNPTARTTPFLLESRLSAEDVTFLHSVDAPVARWREVFTMMERRLADRAKARLARKEERASESGGSRGKNGPGEDDLEAPLSVHADDEMQMDDERSEDVHSMFNEFTQGLSGATVDTTNLAAVVSMLKAKVEAQEGTIAELKEKMEERTSGGGMFGADVEDLTEHIGDVYPLVREYGSVGQALLDTIQRQDNSEAVISTVVADTQVHTREINDLQELTDANKIELLEFLKRLAERSSRQHTSLTHLIQDVQRGIAGGAGGGVDMDTVFGTETVGSLAVDVSMNYVFAQLRGMSGTLEELASRYKSSGVTYQGCSFASPEEFSKWYMLHNPSGSGMAAIVDFVSIWCFSQASAQTSVEWLSTVEKSAKLGLGSQETAYVHTMSHKYPPRLAGKVTVILSTESIKMLKSFDEWRGTSEGMSMGDGRRERILTDVRNAARAHRQYCMDYLPASPLRDLAIKTGEDTVMFYQDLFSYIDQELTNLDTINIKPEHVLLLLSNQVVRLGDDLHALRAFGANIRLDNLPVAATRLAWFSLQAMTCMGTYSKARFRDHPGVNSAYLRFLTCRVAAQAELGIKDVVTALVTRMKNVEKVAAEAATKDSVKKLDNKVEDHIKKVTKGGARPAT